MKWWGLIFKVMLTGRGWLPRMEERENEVPDVGEWLSIEPFSSIAIRVSVMKGTYPIKPFMYSGNWTQQGFYVDRFFPDFEKAL